MNKWIYLHDELLVAELHPVEPRDGLVRDRHVDVLAERVTLFTGIQLGVQPAVDSLNWSPGDNNAIWCWFEAGNWKDL